MPAPKPRRPGAPIRSSGPVAVAAKRLGLSMADIAARLGVNPATVRSWDSRGRVPADMVDALAALRYGAAQKNRQGEE
jgi:uncharacterized protein YjcR